MTSVLRLAMCAAVLAASSAWAGPYSVESIETSGTTFATGASIGTTVERMRITQGGLIGISNTAPIAKLDVGGNISTSGVIQVSGSSLACSAGIGGAIRYQAGSLEYCNAAAWVSSSALGGTVSTFRGHVDSTSFSAGTHALTGYTEDFDRGNNFNPATGVFTALTAGQYFFIGHTHQAGGSDVYPALFLNGSLYQYGTRSYANLGMNVASTVISMAANETVELRLSADAGVTSVFASLAGFKVDNNTSGGGATPGGTDTQVQFNDGGSALGGDAEYTWNKTSNVLAINGLISATNASLTTIYNSGTFSGNAMAANSVSSTLVSSTYVQIASATAVLACGSGLTGTMRYTSGTMQVCNGTSWGNIGIGVPTGTIMAFAASSCPSGWSEYTSARGRFLRGIDNGAGLDPDDTRAGGATQTDAMQGHYHNVSTGGNQLTLNVNFANGVAGVAPTYGGGSAAVTQATAAVTDGSNGTPRTASETCPVNVAVLFCRYDGYQSQLQTGVATLASLSDVSVAGASNGMVLKYSGGTWIASARTGGATPAGSSNDVQFNNSGALAADTGNFTYASNVLKAPIVSTTQNVYTPGVSLTAAGTTYGYLTSTGSYLPNIASNYVSASGISVSGVVQVSGSALTCSSAIKGAIRYSNTSSTLEYCNSTAWTSLGSSDTSVPSFSVHKNGSAQTVTAATLTSLTWSSETFDTNNNFASNRFTPTVAGKYLISAQAFCSNAASGGCSLWLYKNGSTLAAESYSGQVTTPISTFTTIVHMNGSTDYLELAVNSAGTTIDGGTALTYFTGTLIGGGGSGSGGATPGGTDTQVQFNDGGSALGGDADYTWNKTSNVLTVTGDINYTGLLTDTSDRRKKRNIQEFSGDALERLMKLRPVTFQMKQGGSGVEYGFVAQDVLPLFPELVRDRDDTLSLNYIGMMAPMVKAMQQMKAESDVVAAQNRQLRESLHNLAAEVKTLRKAVLRSQGTVH